MKEVFDFLNNKIEFSNSYVIAAISGGPDSMALLDILIRLRDKYNFKIVCAHVNHNVRKESDSEKEFLEDYCKNKNVIFEYMKIEKYDKDNFHNQSRNIRYKFFESLIKKYNSKYLFTAHHGDDLIETILMRITRGSNLSGYSGFQTISKRDKYLVVRPLIFMTKEQLLNYDIENNIPYVIDKSNEKDCYTRNRYRKYILPFLKQENNNIHKKYIEFSNELYKYEQFVDKNVSNAFDKVYNNDILYIDKFLKLDDIIQEKLLEKILKEKYIEILNLIDSKHINLIIDLLKSKKSNSYIELPEGKIIYKEYNKLIFKDKKVVVEDYKFKLENELQINNKTIKIVENSDDTSNYCIRLDSSEIVLPLYIRNKKDGDKIEVKGLNGTKKIKDIFIDSKIGMEERKVIPLLVDSNDEVLWILGLKKSKYDKSKNEKYDIIVKYC